MVLDKIKKELSDLRCQFDFQEVVKRAFKYFVEGGAVAVAAYYIPQKNLKIEEVVMIALTAAAIFAVLDMYAPSIGVAARQGTGFGIGANLAGLSIGSTGGFTNMTKFA